MTSYDDEYQDFIYSCHCDMSMRMFWTDEREFYGYNQFIEHFQTELRRFYHVYFIILDKKSKLPVGFVYSYNFNRSDGLLYETIYICPKYQSRGYGAEAGLLFSNYLFCFFPIRKIYCDVYGYNSKSQQLLKGVGFKLEGQLREHRYFNGAYHDMYRFATFRDEFYKNNQKRISWYQS